MNETVRPGRPHGVKVVADLSTEAGLVDFAADIIKVKTAAPDAVFNYVNDEESACAPKELKRLGVTVPLIGETTVTGQKVIELAGDAATAPAAIWALRPTRRSPP